MPLQGTFDVLDFTEVLRLLARQQLTGRVHVRSRSFGANLFIEEGQLTGADQSEHQPAATAGDVRGRIEEICFEMLDAERGSFEFHPGKASTLPVTGRHRIETVLSRARKRLDEWHGLQETIPSLELQPRLVLDLDRAEVTLDKERWRLLTAIDGRRNLRAIGRALNLSDFDVCRVVASLVNDGTVELEGLAALSAATRDAMPIVAPPDTSGLERVSPSDGSRVRAKAQAQPRPGPLVITTEGSRLKSRKPVDADPASSSDAGAGKGVPAGAGTDKTAGDGAATGAGRAAAEATDPTKPAAEATGGGKTAAEATGGGKPAAEATGGGKTAAEATGGGKTAPGVSKAAGASAESGGKKATPDGTVAEMTAGDDPAGDDHAKRGRRVVRIRSRQPRPKSV